MKRLSEQDIARLRLQGKGLEDVKPIPKLKAEPKKPDPLQELAVAVAQSVERCEQIVQINAQAALEIISALTDLKGQKPVVIRTPEQNAQRQWTFSIERDAKGYIETINARNE